MIDPSKYLGEQIELSSGQLLFNARSESIFINSAKYISLSAGESIHIDIGPDGKDSEQNQLLVNAPKIQLGLNKYGKPEQVVKSDELKKILIELIDKITNFNQLMATASITSPTPIFAALYTSNAGKLSADLNVLKTKLDNFKSKITYTI